MLRTWPVILVLAAIGLGLAGYWLTLEGTPDGVTPQSGGETAMNGILALAGAITTLGTAIFGVLSKLTEHRKAQLDLEKTRLELEEKRRTLKGG